MKRLAVFLLLFSLVSGNADAQATIFQTESPGWFYFIEGQSDARMHFLYMNGIYAAVSGTINKEEMKRFVRKVKDQLATPGQMGNAINTWMDSAILRQIVANCPQWMPKVRELGFTGPYTDNEIINMWSQ